MGLKNSKKKSTAAIVLTVVMLAVWAGAFFQSRKLKTNKAQQAIKKLFAEHGVKGSVQCPEAEFRMGTQIECTAKMSTGETIPVYLDPTSATDAHILAPDVLTPFGATDLLHRHLAKNGVEGKAECPTAQVLVVGGATMRCRVKFADGRDAIGTIKRVEGDGQYWVDFEEPTAELAKKN